MTDNNDQEDSPTVTYESYNDICEALVARLAQKKGKTDKEQQNILNLMKGVIDFKYIEPTPIQEKTIIPLSEGRDIIAQSQSGTGKTGAFVIGVLSRINPHRNYPQAIILATTRELATQINTVCKCISKYMGISTCLTIGGENMSVRDNIREAKRSHIIVGTPGRVNNIIDRNAFKMKHIKALVLDEADALLGSDFRDQIKSILMKLEEDAQICIYSATIDNETLELAENFIEDPLIVTMNEDKLNLDLIQQFKIEMNCDDDKLPTLFDLYGQLTITQAVIFANSINRAKVIYDAMREEGFEVGLIHGHMSSEERVNTLASFRRAEFRVLLATDVIARGIDVQQIGLVFNYDLPKERKTYLHRIGRSGRFKKKGIAINFVVRYNDRRGRDRRNRRNNISDYEKLDNITSHYKNTIHHMPRPDKINEILMGTEVDITRNK